MNVVTPDQNNLRITTSVICTCKSLCIRIDSLNTINFVEAILNLPAPST